MCHNVEGKWHKITTIMQFKTNIVQNGMEDRRNS